MIPRFEKVAGAVRGTDAWRITVVVQPHPKAVVELEFAPNDGVSS